MHVTAVEESRIEDVLAIYRPHRKTLGFLPDSAFRERIERGTLFGAFDENEKLTGYAVFDIPRNEIVLHQLCVDEKYRSKNIARQLVDTIQQHYPSRNGIRLKCRRDFAISKMWPKLEFVPMLDKPGHSNDGHLVTIWWRDFGNPTLFSKQWTPSGTRKTAALDSDVFIDLDDDETREGSETSKQLLSDWADESVELIITTQVNAEVNNNPSLDVRKKQLSRIETFQTAPSTDWKRYESLVLDALGSSQLNTHDRGDVCNIARAKAAGAQYWITRDEDCRQKLSLIARELLGIEVVHPAHFINQLWTEQGEDEYAPVRLADTAFTCDRFDPADEGRVAELFINQPASEKGNAFRSRLRTWLAEPNKWDAQVIRSGGNAIVAVFVRSIEKDITRVPLVRTIPTRGATLARHVLQLQRQYALERGSELINVSDAYLSSSMRSALSQEYFVEADDSWWTMCTPATGTKIEIAEHLRGIKRAPVELELERMADALEQPSAPADLISGLEERFWPVTIYSDELPTFILPIKPTFAAQLFDSNLSAATLFSQDDVLGISREHVYYRSSVASGGLKSPARILWYVSKGSGDPGGGFIRAVSHLVEINIDRPLTLHRRNQHFGVYTRDQVIEAAGKQGKAMALRFNTTQTFVNPISLVELEQTAQRFKTGVQLQSVWRLPNQMFDALHKKGTQQ